MYLLEFLWEPVISQAAFLEDLRAHLVVECRDQIAAQIPSNLRGHLQASGDLKSNLLKEFRGARCVAQYPLNVAISPTPQAMRRIHHTRINRLAIVTARSNPKRWHLAVAFPFLVVSLPHRIPSYGDTVVEGGYRRTSEAPLH